MGKKPYKIFLKNSIHLMNLYINPTLRIYFLQTRQGQLVRFQCLILNLNSNRESTTLIFDETIFHSLRPKYNKVCSALNNVFTIGKRKLVGFLKLYLFSLLRSNSLFTFGREIPLINLEHFNSKETQILLIFF